MAKWKFAKGTIFQRCFYGPNEPVTWNGIPVDGMRPLDDDAQRWQAYARLVELNPELPPLPWCPRRGRLVFPDNLPGYTPKKSAAEPPLPEHDDEPLYEVTEDTAVGCIVYSRGAVLKREFWPNSPHLRPLNKSAELILDFWGRFNHLGKCREWIPFKLGRVDLPPPSMLLA